MLTVGGTYSYHWASKVNFNTLETYASDLVKVSDEINLGSR